MGEGGASDGVLNYVENTGTMAPVFVARTGSANPLDGIDVGAASAPALGDLDGDGTRKPRPSTDKLRLHNFAAHAGDLDLVVGNEDDDYEHSTLIYMENIGTSTAPVFVQRTGSKNPFDGINGIDRIAPALADLDGDGTLRPRPSIDRNLSPHLSFSRRRPGPCGGRRAWLPQLHREHRDVYGAGVCFPGFFPQKQLLILILVFV